MMLLIYVFYKQYGSMPGTKQLISSFLNSKAKLLNSSGQNTPDYRFLGTINKIRGLIHI